RETGLRPTARRAVPPARTTHGRRRSALSAAKQARTQGPPAGARNHDPLDCAWPPGADREPLRGAGGRRVERRRAGRLARRAAAAPRRDARFGRGAFGMAERRRAWGGTRTDFGL